MAATENKKVTIRINGKEVRNDIKTIAGEFRKLRAQVAQTERGTQAYREGVAELRRVKGILDAHRRDIRGVSQEVKKAGSAWKNVGKIALGVFGGNLLTRGVQGLQRAFGDARRTVVDFEKAQAGVASVLGTTSDKITALTSDAKRLGASTAFTATQVSELQAEFARLGFSQSEILKSTEPTLNLAAATGESLAETAAVAGATVRAFGLDASETTRVTDVMAKSFSSSGLSLEKFSETMKTAAPIAKAANISLEEATAAAGKLADANITGSKAGTDLKNIFSELAKDGKPLQQSLEDVAAKLEAAGSPAERLAIANDLVGERAKASLLVLAEQTDSLRVLGGALENAGGAAEQMANTQLDTLSGKSSILTSAWEGFILSLDDGTGVLSQVAGNILEVATGVLEWATGTDNLSGKLIEEQVNLNLLVGELTSANLAEQERSEKIQQLQDQYPGFLGDIDAESASNETLRDRLSEVNAAYQNRIILQRQSEERAEAEGNLAEARQDRAEAIQNLLRSATEGLADLAAEGDKNAQAQLEQLNSLDSVAERVRLISEIRDEDGFGGFFDADQNAVQRYLGDLSLANARVRLFAKGNAELVESQKEAREILGIGDGDALPTDPLREQAKQREADAKKAREDERKAREAAADAAKAQQAEALSAKEREKQLQQEINDLQAEARLAEIDGNTEKAASLELELYQKRQELDGGRSNGLETVDPLSGVIESDPLEPTLQGVELIQQKVQELREQGPVELVRSFDADDVAAVADFAGQAAGALLSLQSSRIDQEQAAELEALEEQREAKVLSAEEFEKKRKAIEDKARKDQQRAAIAEVFINAAVAATKAATKNAPPSPAFYASLALIGLNTAAQVKAISAQKFATGGEFLLDGPSHAAGGMDVLNGFGQKVAELEGGEFIIRKNAVNASTIPLLQAINTGNWPEVDFSTLQPRRKRTHYQEGGEFDPPAVEAPAAGGEVLNELRALNQSLNGWQSSFRVQLPLKDLDSATARRDAVQKIADVG